MQTAQRPGDTSGTASVKSQSTTDDPLCAQTSADGHDPIPPQETLDGNEAVARVDP